MWNYERTRRDKNGKSWNFAYWHEFRPLQRVQSGQRLFFWDDEHDRCGVVLFPPERPIHYRRLRNLIDNLVADPDLREQYERELHFPFERHYSEYGAFPEEISN